MALSTLLINICVRIVLIDVWAQRRKILITYIMKTVNIILSFLLSFLIDIVLWYGRLNQSHLYTKKAYLKIYIYI